MRLSLAPSFVVTLAALSPAGCRTAEPTANPPPPTATGVQPSATAPVVGNPPTIATRKRHRSGDGGSSSGSNPAGPIDYASLETLNPTDAAGAIVFAASDYSCYTSRPDPNPPKNLPTGVSPTISTAVDCPLAMDDPAWDTCDERLARSRVKGECYCMPTGGNPPPPPRLNACPKK